MTQDPHVNAGTRLASMLLDHLFMTMIAMVFFLPQMVYSFAGAFNITHEPTDMNMSGGPLLYIGLFGFAVYFCKDCVKGRSLGKRIARLQVLDNRSGEVASPLQCLVRNIFIIAWPIEGIVALANPARRIGDFVAGTRVASYKPAVTTQPLVNVWKLLFPLALAYGVMLLIMWPLRNVTPDEPQIKYVKSSYNPTESKALERAYNDSLGEYLTASVRVYDKVENMDIKYISVIYRLKENFLEDEVNAEELKRLTNHLLYNKYQAETFTGQAKYVFQGEGTMKANINSIGKPLSRVNVR
jgi:uncharacterized RDD family membrane protein YckC